MARWRAFMLLLAALSYGAGIFLGGYPWQLALLTSFAVVALAYSARRVYFEQRRLYRSSASWEVEPTSADVGDLPEDGSSAKTGS